MKGFGVFLLLILTLPAEAKSIGDEILITAAAAMVEIAQSSQGISRDEEWLIKTQFPLRRSINPVMLFTLDRTNLPLAMAQLKLTPKRAEKIMVFLGLVAIIDNEIQPEEKELLLRHYREHKSLTTFDDIIQQARKLQLKLRHKKLKEDLQNLAQAVLQYHKENGYYIATEQYPKKNSTRPYTWIEQQSGNFQILDWKPPGTNFGCFQVEASENTFTATAIIDVDNDGEFATYTTSHTSPESTRKTTREVQ